MRLLVTALLLFASGLCVSACSTGGGDDDGAADSGPGTGGQGDVAEPATDAGDAKGPDATGGSGSVVGPVIDLGVPCGENDQCESGYCVDGFQGSVCTQTCLDGCPEGWACRSITNTYPDIVFVCVPNAVLLCKPCESDVQCNGGRCVAVGAESYCTSPCGDGDPCPTGFECLVDDAAGSSYCAPLSGSCECTVGSVGQTRPCGATNELGTCIGFEECLGADGFAACSAKTPSAEVCNGLDDDCDGQYDEDVGSGDPCTLTNDVGTCTGIQTCLGASGIVCSAREPVAEVCNYVDDDCDGVADDDFKVGEQYGVFDHCGACGVTCKNGFPNATSMCGLTTSPPQCVVETCAPGYFQLNPYQCIPFAPKVCEPCVDDLSCALPGSRCLQLEDGKFCGKACTTSGDCQQGYSCASPDGGSLQCTPDTGTCSCDGSSTNLQRSCELSVQGDDPGAPVTVCLGTQQCTGAGWGQCKVPTETCDGADNDCDGAADGPWVDADGRYVADVHCGVCDNNCLAAPPPNATGSCDTSGPVPACTLDCLPGFLDVNDNPADGCECAFAGDADKPDGVDQNCDGVDGNVLGAVFVAKNGSPEGAGTLFDPLLTVQQGIDRALSLGFPDVYVATGVYQEDIRLRPGISVFGGYRGDFLARNTTLYETAMIGLGTNPGAPGTINAKSLQGPAGSTVLDGFLIFGADATLPGRSSYAIWVIDCGDALVLSNNRVVAGDGGDGVPGKAGTSGTTGVSGAKGLIVKDVGVASCSGTNEGGAGGELTCGSDVVSGGGGGSAVCPDYDENSPASCPAGDTPQSSQAVELGGNGVGAAPGSGGNAGFDGYSNRAVGPYSNIQCVSKDNANCGVCLNPEEGLQGESGSAGAVGTDGIAGPGCSVSAGSVIAHLFVPEEAGDGLEGTHGSGGGGGGAGGGVEVVDCQNQAAKFSDFGGSGGGGGSGGCGATAGSHGGSGGGSFGLFLSFSVPLPTVPTLLANTVVRGRGGNGGFGGSAQRPAGSWSLSLARWPGQIHAPPFGLRTWPVTQAASSETR